MEINKIMRPVYFILLWSLLLSFQSVAANLSFSARLVNSDGSPVAGPVDLRFDLAYSGTQGNIECSKDLFGVELSSGVFHVNLDFLPANCGGTRELEQVLQETPDTQSLMMQVSDRTDTDNIKTYPFQALNSVPISVMSEVSKTLIKMGADAGEVLKWNGTEWAPASDDGEPGTVTDIEAGNGLTANGVSGGTITGSGVIAVAPGGIDVGMLADNAVTTDKIVDGTIQNVDIDDGVITYEKLNIGDGKIPVAKVSGLGSAAYANIGMENGNVLGASELPACSTTQKLRKILSPVPGWTCEDDSTGEDDTKLPLLGGTMDGTINMAGNALTNVQTPLMDGDAATKKYVDDGLANKADSTQLGDYVAKAGDSMTGALQLDAQNELRLADSDSTNYVALRSNANVGTNFILTLPSSAGTADQVLTTDGNGALTWTTPASSASPEGSAGGELAGSYPNPTINDNVIDDANVMTGANINAAKIGTGAVSNTEFNTLSGVTSSIQTQLDAKEGTITAGTTAQYLSGDKTWKTLDTAAVPENGPLYFTNARAQGAVVTQAITDGVTATSPSEDAMFDALASKANTTDLDSYVLKAGDTMSGALDMGTNAVSNLAAPSLDADAATKKYVDDGLATKADSTDLGDYVATAGDSMTGSLQLDAQNELRLADSDSTNYVALRSNATVGTNFTLTLPASAGSLDQVLTTDGNGVLTWTTPASSATPEGTAGGELAGTYPNPTIEDGVIDDANIATNAAIAITKLGDGTVGDIEFSYLDGVTSSIQTQLDAKEGTITAGTTAQYWRGDKSWQTLNTTVVPEGTNLYYTTTRARTDAVDDAIVDAVTDVAPSQNAVFDALALKADGTDLNNYVEIAGSDMTGPLGLNAQTQIEFRDSDSSNFVGLRAPAAVGTNYVLSLPVDAGTGGQVLSTDGSGNLSWVSSGSASVTDVTATAPLASSGGTTPALTITQANTTTDGYVSSTDWNTFIDKEPAITIGSTAQYWRGDKSWQTLNTSVVPEGTNLYYTTTRARTDAVDDAIVDAVTDVAPSQNAVNDALALKADASSLSSYVLKGGDTMTGPLNLPLNGLAVGTGQLVASGGNVGIGTSTPGQLLHVEGSSDSVVKISATNAGSNAQIEFSRNGTGTWIGPTSDDTFDFWSSENIPMIFGVNNSEALRITNSGDVGIGTGAPSEKLQVNGNVLPQLISIRQMHVLKKMLDLFQQL